MKTRTSIWVVIAAIALLLIGAAAWVLLPHQSERWMPPDPKAPDAAMLDRVRVIKRTEGFRLSDRGLAMTRIAAIPHLKDRTPLSEALFEKLHRDIAQTMRTDHAFTWSEVWDAMGEKVGMNQWSQQISFEVITHSPTVVSLRGQAYAYTGGAHGSFGPTGENFVWRDGQMIEVKLEDLFEPGSDWLTLLAKDVEADLRRQKASFVDDALPFDATKLGTFTINRDGLAIYFAPYQVASYAEGTMRVVEPWEKLRKFMKADSPVTRWVDEAPRREE